MNACNGIHTDRLKQETPNIETITMMEANQV